MKNTFQLICILFLLAISSCIPSLHPIFTANDRVINDKILGIWSQQSNDKPVIYDITIQSDDEEELKKANKLQKTNSLFGEDNSIWHFERAANISFEKKLKGGRAQYDFKPGAPSFIAPPYEITKKEDLPYYILTHKEISFGDTTSTVLIVNLTEINGNHYLDFRPHGLKDKTIKSRFGANYIKGHTFAKITFEEKGIKIMSFNDEYITELIENKKIRLKHENLGEDQVVLTASTKELRAFISKYGNDERLYESSEPMYLY